MPKRIKHNPRHPLNFCQDMPPLSHWPKKPAEWRIEDSQVVQWITSNPITMRWLFYQANSRGLIKHDKASGLWMGANTLAAHQNASCVNVAQPLAIPEGYDTSNYDPKA